MDDRDRLIVLLAERIYICSSLLGAAAERLRWDSAKVQELMQQLCQVTKEQVDASIQETSERDRSSSSHGFRKIDLDL